MPAGRASEGAGVAEDGERNWLRELRHDPEP